MIEKQINHDSEAIELLYSGIQKISMAVGCTLGAGGRTVILEDDFGRPHATKDGISVAKSITLSDPVENLGASVLRQASMKTADMDGDGTTSTMVVAHGMIKEAFDTVDGFDVNVSVLRRDLEKVSKIAIQELEKIAKKVTPETLEDVATISSNNDKELGKIISDAYKKVGMDGAISIEESMTSKTYTTIIDGTRIKRGYGSNMMINNKENNTCVLNDPLVLLCDKKIDAIDDINIPLMASIENKRPLLIVADVADGVMNSLNVNIASGKIRVCVVSPEGVGLNRIELLEDLAAMTDAIVVSDETGNDFAAFSLDFLGSAKKSLSTDKETVITLKSDSTADAVKDRANNVRKILQENKDSDNNWHYRDRLSRLSGGIAAIHVGASTDVEMKEKKDRIEDAIFATRAALEEGVVAGGGAALSYVAHKVSKKFEGTKEEKASVILCAGLTSPFRLILINAGIELDYVPRKNQGVNVITGKRGNMFTMGIIDPLKVVKSVIRNATSVTTTLLTTNCVVSNKRA